MSPPDDWTPPSPLPALETTGDYVTIRPLSADDFAGLWEAFSADDGSMWEYMGYGPFADGGELAATASQWIGSSDPRFHTFWVDGGPVGWGSFLRIEPAHAVAEIGHLAFSPALRRTRAATEAIYLMMRHVFASGYRRCEWKCDAGNAASRAAAERFGFTFEGVFRQHMVVKGRNRDTAWYSVIDSEWPRVRRAFEAWLDPSNFDASGRQKRRLAELPSDANQQE